MDEQRHTLVGIQVLRGVAALLVVLHHTLEESLVSSTPPTSPDWLTTFGAAGVDIFFVISGFIMLHVSFSQGRPPDTTLPFLAKRIARIYPFYWVCIAATMLLWSVGFYKLLIPSFGMISSSLLLLPSEHRVIGIAWTLVYEMYFYLLFSITLFRGSQLVSLIATTILILIGMALGNFISSDPVRSFLKNPIALEFCYGMFLAYLFQRRADFTHIARPLWIIGFACIAAAPLWIDHPNTNGLPDAIRILVWGIPAVLVVASFLSMRIGAGSRAMQLAVAIGDASYAIYLTHPFVMISYARLLHSSKSFSNLPQVSMIPFVVLTSALLGLVAHRALEAPLIKVARTFMFWMIPLSRRRVES
jgi:exopolysaccharide production protein ExoZ